MNHAYRLIWKDATQSFVVVAEHIKSRSKRSGGTKTVLAALGVVLAAGAYAQQAPIPLPTGGQVVVGQAGISGGGNVLTVNQATDKAAINWTTFSIGKGGAVNFVQPSSSSVVLNRVVGNERSVIDGALNANGQVFLLNSNGVLFGRDASVNTAGLVASTMALSDADFQAGNYKFSGGNAGSVINLGTLKAADGGYVALLGKEVQNQGVITARLGTVALAAGEKISLNFNGSSLVNVVVDQGALDALVENRQAIHADGGLVILTAKAVDALLANVVNNTGEIRANTVENRDGRIFLLGGFDGGSVNVAGTLDASAPQGGNGGFIETSGAHVRIDDGVKISTAAASGATGTWLIDPNDYTIAASGGNISGATLSASLANSNVTIQTATQGTAGGNGDIFVNDAITKTGSAATTLTLKAERHINVNQAITASDGRLNVVLTADADNNASGNVVFGSNGKVVTNNGNFTAGGMSGNSAVRGGQNFSMAAGSSIDVGKGNLDISVNGTATLAAGSLKATNSTGSPPSYYNDGTARYYQQNYININAGGILSANTDAALADIVASTDVTLNAGTIGALANPIKLSGPDGLTATTSFPNVGRTLYVGNTTGNSYVSEMGNQVFSTVHATVGSQLNSIHNIQIMGDAGGNGSTGTGHIILRTNGSGVLALAYGDIDTRGIPGTYTGDYATSTDPSVFATSVSLNAPNITFESRSVNVGQSGTFFYYPHMHNWGIGSYYATFSATASTSLKSSQADGIGDILAYAVSLTGPNIGTSVAPVELGLGSILSLYNTGGSTFVKATQSGFGTVNLTNYKTAGTHAIRFSDGDHIDYVTDGTKLAVASIGQVEGETTGIDTHGSNRSVSLYTYSGAIEFGTNSVNLGAGTLTAALHNGNTDRVSGKAIYAASAKDGAADITAGNVAFNIYSSQAGAIKDIEIAKGGTGTSNSLSVYTYAGDIDIAELTENHLKSLTVQLQGTGVAQNIKFDLAGADDVNFSDSGSLITIDGAKVNLSAGNRNWSLQAYNRAVQIDGTSLSSGSYNVYGGQGIRLNGDVLTNGGAITLNGGSSLRLLKSARIDSNADDLANSASTGSAGSITLYAPLSATGAGQTLTVDSASSTTSGSSIQVVGDASNQGGAYLAGLSLDARGVQASNDGSVYLYGSSYLLNGDFQSAGNTILQNSVTLDTEQGNLGNAGNISFGGRSLSLYSWGNQRFDTSTTAVGAHGGNIDLANTVSKFALAANNLTVVATGGAGGTAGNINLPSVSTVHAGTAGSQSYTGGIITLNGDLYADKANITLTGDTRLATNVTIDTWWGGAVQNGTAGTVRIDGAGVSGAAAGKTLTITTAADTGTGYFDTPNKTGFIQNGGAVSIAAGTAGGNALQALSIDTRSAGTYNTGSAGAITLNGVTTQGSQTYAGGSTAIGGDLLSNGGNIDLANTAAVTLASKPIAIRTDMAGGSGNAGTLNLGARTLNGAADLAIDTTADGGGAAAALALNAVGNTSALGSLNVRAGSVDLGGGIAASGDITIESTGTDATLTVDHAVSSADGNITVASARNVINTVGANAFATGEGKHWQVWSSTPLDDDRNGLAYDFKQYNAVYGQSTVLGTGNGLFYTLAPTITASVTGSFSKVYNGSAAAAASSANLSHSGAVDGDAVVLGGTLTGSYADANAGTGKTVTIGGIALQSAGNDGKAVYGYTLASTSASADIGTITPKALTINGMTATNRTYDGTTDVALSGGSLSGLVGTETLSFYGQSGSIADKHAGQGKAVTVGGIVLADAGTGSTAGLASNYSIANPTGLTVDIAKRALTVTATAADKVYDGNATASVTLSDNRISEDVLTVSKTAASFNNKHAGSGKTVSVTGIDVTGTDAANYTFNTTASATASIAKRALTVAAAATNKIYDGNTTASVTLSDDRIGEDVLTVTKTAANFADKNAGNAKTVSVTGIDVSGTDAANYTFNTTASTTADITKRALTVAAAAANKIYDGNTTAGVTLSDNRVSEDVLTITNTAASFSDKNAGNGKTVNVTGIDVGGTDAANYTFNTTASTTADIAKRTLTVAAAAANKVYDGNATANVTLSDNRVSEDVLTVTNTAAGFSDKNAGAGKTVSVTGIDVTGTDAANYTFNTTASATADIAKRALTVAATAAGKVYDGNTTAGVTLSDNRIDGDTLILTNTAANFADKNAGSGKTVSITGINVGGTDAANYTFNTTASATADIAKRALTVAASAADKVYDGNTTAGVTLSDNRVSEDVLAVTSAAANFADKNAGNGKVVSVTGIDVSGTDAANYTFNTTAQTSANIAKRALTVAAAAANKIYDGNATAGVTLSDNRVEGDVLDVVKTAASFADKNAGNGKTVSVTGIDVGGADAGNYTFNTTASTTAAIAKRALTVAAFAADKVYDGNTTAGVTLSDNRVAGDLLNIANAAASFSDKNAGSGKTVGVTGISVTGADAANYTFNGTALASADITRRALTVTATGISRMYDGTTRADVVLHDDRLSGDALSIAHGGASFGDPNVGNAKPVKVDSIAISGTDAGNYEANAIAVTSADIKTDAIYTSTVTNIANHNTVAVAAPVVSTPAPVTTPSIAANGFQVTSGMPAAIGAGFSEGSQVLVVMTPTTGGRNERISGDSVTQLVAPQPANPGAAPAPAQVGPGRANTEIVRIPLSQNSIASVVNGGVNLPEGVSQEFILTSTK